MSRGQSDDAVILEVAASADAFERLRDGAAAAISAPAKRVLVDLSRVDPVDGAMLAVVTALGRALGPNGRIALVASKEAARQMAEWRLDTLWLLFCDRETALEALAR